MKKVELLTPDAFPQWDEFVETQPKGSIYHTSGWKEVLEKNFKQITGKIIAIRDYSRGDIVAGMPIYTIRSFPTGKRLVSIPFALDGTPLAATAEELKLLLNHIINLFNYESFSYIEIRSLLPLNSISKIKYGLSEFYQCHYLSLSNNPTELISSFHKKAVQVPIRKLKGSRFELRLGEDEKDLFNFFQIFYQSRKRMGLPIIPYGFFESLWSVFKPKDQIAILVAIYEGQAAGSAILLKFNDTVTVEYGVDLINFRKLYVNHFLDWESIKIASYEGYKKFCFGRTSPNNEGLLTYKARWGTDSINLPTYYYPENRGNSDTKRETSLKFKFARTILSSSPDFIYIKLSSLINNYLR